MFSLTSALQTKPLIPDAGRGCSSLPQLSSFEPPGLLAQHTDFCCRSQGLGLSGLGLPILISGTDWSGPQGAREGEVAGSHRLVSGMPDLSSHCSHMEMKCVVQSCLSRIVCALLFTWLFISTHPTEFGLSACTLLSPNMLVSSQTAVSVNHLTGKYTIFIIIQAPHTLGNAQDFTSVAKG